MKALFGYNEITDGKTTVYTIRLRFRNDEVTMKNLTDSLYLKTQLIEVNGRCMLEFRYMTTEKGLFDIYSQAIQKASYNIQKARLDAKFIKSTK